MTINERANEAITALFKAGVQAAATLDRIKSQEAQERAWLESEQTGKQHFLAAQAKLASEREAATETLKKDKQTIIDEFKQATASMYDFEPEAISDAEWCAFGQVDFTGEEFKALVEKYAKAENYLALRVLESKAQRQGIDLHLPYKEYGAQLDKLIDSAAEYATSVAFDTDGAAYRDNMGAIMAELIGQANTLETNAQVAVLGGSSGE